MNNFENCEPKEQRKIMNMVVRKVHDDFMKKFNLSKSQVVLNSCDEFAITSFCVITDSTRYDVTALKFSDMPVGAGEIHFSEEAESKYSVQTTPLGR